MQPDGILETSLYADDLRSAEEFYGQILGLQLINRDENRHLFYRCGNSMLLIFRAAAARRRPLMGARHPVPPHGAEGPGHVCFRILAADFPRWIDRLKRNRVRIEADFTWPIGGRSIYFRDPAGNSLEFAEARIWPLT